MADDRKNDKDDEVLELDPLTGGKTVAQTPTNEEDIRDLPGLDTDEGPQAQFDTTTGTAFPVERDR
jgi:hypothetical protein